MADDVAITAGSGTNVATDDIGGRHFQRVKVTQGADGTATDVSSTAPLPIYRPDGTATGTISATDAVLGTHAGNGVPLTGTPTANSYVFYQVQGGESGFTLRLSGTFGGGTVWMESSVDSTNGVDGAWTTNLVRQSGIDSTTLDNSITSAGIFRGVAAGYAFLRVRVTGATTPSIGVVIRASDGPSVTAQVASLPPGANVIGTVRSQGVALTPTSGNVAAAGTGTIGPMDVSTAGNVTFIAKNQTAGTAWAGAPVLVFEQSDDSTSWGPLQVVRADNGAIHSTHTLPANAANVEYLFDAPAESINYVRCRVTTGPTTNPMTVVIAAGGMPFSPALSVIKSSIQPTALSVQGNAANQTPPGNGGTGTVHVSGSATVATTALVAAPAAGLSIYVTDIETTNAGASAQTITLHDGTGTAPRYVRYMAASGGGGVTNLRTPWKLTAATALGYQVTAAVQYYMTINYFVAP